MCRARYIPVLTLMVLMHWASPILSQYNPLEGYTVADGLPSNQVYDIIQDQLGYYWIGTDKGLVNFDGYEFKVFTVKDGLPSNDVYEVDEDVCGRIWVFEVSKVPTYIKEGTKVIITIEGSGR